MTSRRLLAVAALAGVGALIGTTTSGPASARPVEDRCIRGGSIPAPALAAASQLGCSLVGRIVTDGRVSVVVPPAGITAAGEGVGRRGDVRGLRVTNTGTAVVAVTGGGGLGGLGGGGWYLAPLGTNSTPPTTPATTPPTNTATTNSLTTTTTTTTTSPVSTLPTTPTTVPTTTPTVGTPARASDLPACRDRAFELENHRWTRSLRYRVNLAKMPQRFHRKTVVGQVRSANRNMRKGRNTCGKPALGTPVGRYLGRTSKKPNVTRGPGCGHLNTTNVVGFGNLPGTLLGWTCYWYRGGRMIAADIMVDNGRSLATKVPDNCSNTWDFEGTVTHEWGHAYGLAHTGPSHGNLTMHHLLKPCSTYARTLGLGDWRGMKHLYGVR
jgi:hypothetical protein